MFNIGDEVLCTEEYDDNDEIVDASGTIKAYNGVEYLVEFDGDVGGHEGWWNNEALCEEGTGWWVNPEILEYLYPVSLENE